MREDQSALLCEHLEKNTRLYVKDIAAYVLSVFGVKYSISGMHSWLKSNGFTYKKPAVLPGKVDVEKQKQWLAAVPLSRKKTR
ncbi:MAG: winged helix-turn-helix domain-containing protein [Chlamydiota bacterium]